MTERARAAACAGGVLALTAAWVVAGLTTDGFDPRTQSISQLQRAGTATGAVMTSAFLAFSAGALAFAPVIGARMGRKAQAALVTAGLATLGVAVSPLGEVRGGLVDDLHLAFGATGYAALSVLPLLAAHRLPSRARAASYAVGAAVSACLLGTVPADELSGLLQRGGFVLGHGWLVGCAVAVWRSPPGGTSGTSAPDRGIDLRARRRRRRALPRRGRPAGRRTA